jgi:hypothetical protein
VNGGQFRSVEVAMTKARIGTIVVLVILVIVLGMAIIYAFKGLEVPGAAMPEAGWIALFFGALLSMLVGVGLMALLFFSSRQGYDEPPHFENDPGDNSRP